MTKTIAASKYPHIPVDFAPKFLTHADEARISEGEFAVEIENENPAAAARGNAILAFLLTYHPTFPVA